MDRRSVLQMGAMGGMAAALGSCGSNPYLNEPRPLTMGDQSQQHDFNVSGKVYNWKLALFVPLSFEIWAPGVQRFAENARILSKGQLNITVKGAGEIVPSLQIFDAVKDGDIEMGHAASYFWDGKDERLRAAVYYTSVPFGMTAMGSYAWIHAGGGQELWDEMYEPFNLKPLPLGNTGVQAGGWFRRPIKTISDLKGIKMRMPGLGGKVLTRAGGVAQTLPGQEIYMALESGRIDATEWIGPYHDYKREFYAVAPYYYTGGWHEPGSVLELLINKDKWDELPQHLQYIVNLACVEADRWMSLQWAKMDAIYYDKLKKDPDIHVADYPEEIASALKPYSQELKDDIKASSDIARRIHDSYHEFQRLHEAYYDASELTYVRGRDA